MEPRIVSGKVYVLPCGKKKDYLVEVDGFICGGIVITERLTSGHTKEDITLTTSNDKELSDELGVKAIEIDEIRYEAINTNF